MFPVIKYLLFPFPVTICNDHILLFGPKCEGAGTGVHLVELATVVLASHTKCKLLFLIQLPANTPGKAMDIGSSAGAIATHRRGPGWNSSVLALT